MKTTIDLPEDLLRRTKISAAQRRTSIKQLVIEGLENVLKEEMVPPIPEGALLRLEKGFHLGGRFLTREEAHAR